MTKRLVEIDDDLLDEARRVQGSPTVRQTVETALRRSVEEEKRRSLSAEDIAAFAEATRDARDPAVMAQAWE